MWVTDAAIERKTFGSGMTALIILNKKMDEIMKISKSFTKSGLLIKVVTKTM